MARDSTKVSLELKYNWFKWISSFHQGKLVFTICDIPKIITEFKLSIGAVSEDDIDDRIGGTAALIKECAGCGKRITERFLLKALDLFWHEDCLKCGCCDCRLGEVGSTLYTKANLILCKRDYLRLFGTTGFCAACNKVIPAFEMVMRAKTNVYHLECFACQQCNHRFCVGDRFYLCDNKILCEYDYEERLVFANMAYNPSNLAHIRRQVGNLQVGKLIMGMRKLSELDHHKKLLVTVN
ncbi:LIM domain only protein 3-like [Lycorma delicatula]|uniref:LIM domain only protein 3-like n=1 Tax=Lycorma delicatula TaxID=130591 RepID=UPI003F510295